jgi:3-dehydroquinate synthase
MSMLTGTNSKCIFLKASEDNKTLESASQIISKMHELGANKETQVFAIGGGIIQDVATLVSSLYMRGLKWIFIPTTKMAQLDSCLGGKSSINLVGIKNIIGNIYPPSRIYIDGEFEKTLNAEAIAAGYLEAIKISYASGREEFKKHLDITNQYSDMSEIPFIPLSKLVLNQKKRFIEQDEFDKGIRQLLNFGHTFAHALESATNYRIQHGVAVGIGMIMAMKHPAAVITEDEEFLREAIMKLLGFAGANSLINLMQIESRMFIKAFQSDKKHRHDSYCLILPGVEGLEKKYFPRSIKFEDLIVTILESTRVEFTNELW